MERKQPQPELDDVVKYFFPNESQPSVRLSIDEILKDYRLCSSDLQYSRLKAILCSESEDECIDRIEFRSALERLVGIGSSDSDDQFLIAQRAMNSDDSYGYIESGSFGNSSSEDYGKRISELQNEIKRKDQDINYYKKQLKAANEKTQSCEEKVSALMVEKDNLLDRIRKYSLTVNNNDYDEIFESNNELLEKLDIQKKKLERLQRQNELLKTEMEIITQEKKALNELINKHEKDKKRLCEQLIRSNSDKEIFKEEYLKSCEKIEEQNKIIDRLIAHNTDLENDLKQSKEMKYQKPFKNSLDSDSQNFATTFSDYDQTSLNASKNDSKLEDNLSMEDGGDVSKKFSTPLFTSTPYNKLSLMEELSQINNTTAFGDDGNKFTTSIDSPTFKDQESQTTGINFNTQAILVNSCSQTDFTGSMVVKTNSTVCTINHCDVSCFNQFWNYAFGKGRIIMILFLLIMAILHLCNIFKFITKVETGTNVGIVSWSFTSFEEFVNLFFNREYNNNEPIPF